MAGVVILNVLCIGGACSELADQVMVPGIEDFRVEGTLVLPTKGDRVALLHKDTIEGAWLMCAGRRFNFNAEGVNRLFTSDGSRLTGRRHWT